LENGLHCANSSHGDPNFVPIGNPELIDRRAHRVLPDPFVGVLSDYVLFYFTPFSPMMYNIKTGHGGVVKRGNEDVIILVSSVWKLQEHGVQFIFSDRHAYLQAACFYDDPAQLDKIDWDLLQRRDFKRDPNDPSKFERYQAELLARTHVPVEALLGVACYNERAKRDIEADMEAANVTMNATVKTSWYF
jgi:hypothetical protein